MTSLGLYFHIPFCARRCDYCDFFVLIGHLETSDFFGWLARDLAGAAERGAASLGCVDTIYFGGGTPSHVPAAEIARLLELCARRFNVERGAEVTLEANPEDVTRERARAWREGGVNRLSLGVQSFTDAVLGPRGRVYSSAEALEAFRAARSAGFENIGLDLIAGLPGETIVSFAEGVRRVIDLSAEHVSLYILETEESGKETPLARAVAHGRERLPDDEATVAMYTEAAGRLVSAGYRHYEISNFARPARESRHNMKYWTSQPWLGLGPSAHSYVDGRRFGRPADLREWMEQVGSGRIEGDYTLPAADARAREALVLELRLIQGVDLAAFGALWGFDPARTLAREIDGLCDEGLVSREAGRLSLTRRGLLLSNEVFARLT